MIGLILLMRHGEQFAGAGEVLDAPSERAWDVAGCNNPPLKRPGLPAAAAAVLNSLLPFAVGILLNLSSGRARLRARTAPELALLSHWFVDSEGASGRLFMRC